MNQSNPLPFLVAIIGPTGTGKTALAEGLALEFKGELVSADSKQVYKGMDIGTAKEKNLKVPQHLIDLINPGERITVGQFQKLAFQTIDEILTRQNLPILVGCSMLYSEAVMEGYQFGGKDQKQKKPRYRVLKLGIAWEREVLLRRIDQRTSTWVEAGLLGEIQRLLNQGVEPNWLEQCGQEYRFFTRHLLGQISLEEAIRLTNISLHQYVKRQYTWWRRSNNQDVKWIKNLAEAADILTQELKKQK